MDVEAPQTEGIVVTPSPSDLRLLTCSVSTAEVDLSDVELSSIGGPLSLRESPDDLFVGDYRPVLGQRPELTIRKLDELQGALHRFMTAGESYISESAQGDEERSLEVRTCEQYLTSDRRDVCWVRYLDTRTETFLVPNLLVFDVAHEGMPINVLGDAQRMERFFAGEVRVVLTSGSEGAEVGIFATPECGPELVEHFLAAIRGADQASYLFYLWQRELSAFFNAHGLTIFQDAPEDFVRDETTTSCVSHGCGPLAGSDYLNLEVSLRDPCNPLLLSLFGSRSIACRMVFNAQSGRSWQRPHFEWRV
ncbi:MAG: hypothetical protein RL518_1989 [Pseudomonadota bacterium]|jgi:hypothetical protein